MYILHIYYTHTYVCMYICNMQLRSFGDLGVDTASVASELEVKWKIFPCSLSYLIKFGREGILSRKKQLKEKSVFKGNQYGPRTLVW